MRINLENWEHGRLSSKKLPSEEDLQDFFSYIVIDPVHRREGFFESVIKFDYPNERGYRNNQYPNISSETTWITPSLNNLSSEVELSTSEYALVNDTDNYNKAGHQRNITPLAMTLDPEVISIITTTSDSNCLSKQWTIKNFKDLSSIVYSIQNFIATFMHHESNIFRGGLQRQGYVQQNTHSQILEKIKKLKTIYPSAPVYILAESPLLDYLKVHSKAPGELENNSWLVLNTNSNYYGNNNNSSKFENYNSAIFATTSMFARHKFEVHYILQRENRQWKVYLAIIGKLGMDIPKDPLEKESLNLAPPNNHSRWNKLFQ